MVCGIGVLRNGNTVFEADITHVGVSDTDRNKIALRRNGEADFPVLLGELQNSLYGVFQHIPEERVEIRIRQERELFTVSHTMNPDPMLSAI